MERVIITIARHYGSGGKTIGQMLAKELGINCYDREILRMASDDSGIAEGLFGQADEKMKKVDSDEIQTDHRQGAGRADRCHRSCPQRPDG